MKKKIVYVIGVFDLFHRGHVEFLKKARALGDYLIVAINGDNMVETYKRRPIYSEYDRLTIVEAVKYVDEAFIINEYDNKYYLEKFDVNVIVHGDDWEESSYMDQIRVSKEYLIEKSIELELIKYTIGISTSKTIEKIKSGYEYTNS